MHNFTKYFKNSRTRNTQPTSLLDEARRYFFKQTMSTLNCPSETYIFDVYGVILEEKLDSHSYALVILADGTINFYTSTNTVYLGLVMDEELVDVIMHLFALIDEKVESFEKSTHYKLLEMGKTQFNFLCQSGKYRICEDTDRIQNQFNRFHEIYYTAQKALNLYIQLVENNKTELK